MARTSLPIDESLPQIGVLLRQRKNLIIRAAPGAGKTTRVPPFLLEEGFAGTGEVIVVEPRRLAARLAAKRVAAEMGQPVGKAVGYTVRYDDVSSAATRIRFVTEGVLTRRLLADRRLRDIGTVVLDEFHERHLQGDLALALLRRLQCSTRPDLHIIVMSATLDTSSLAAYLDASVCEVAGFTHPVTVSFSPDGDPAPLADQVALSVRRATVERESGDILVFLPGAAEIRKSMKSCASVAQLAGLAVHPLHGELAGDEQDAVIRPSTQRKLILSTNVAESSVTIDGVSVVIDSGLARIAAHSPWTGLPTLTTSRISQASATQRTGRAGRTQPGHCIRLYSEPDFRNRAEFDSPEIARADLSESLLELAGLGLRPADIQWFEAPPDESIASGETLLRRLKAIDADGTLTELGECMIAFSIHPRLSRLLVETESRGIAEDGATVAALLSEGDIEISGFGVNRGGRRSGEVGTSDILDRLEKFRAARATRFDRDTVSELLLDTSRLRQVDRLATRLSRLTRNRTVAPSTPAKAEEAILLSVLTGFPDRVARRTAGSESSLRRSTTTSDNVDPEFRLAGGGIAYLAPASSVRMDEFLLAIEVREREQRLRTGNTVASTSITVASAIKVEWLLDLFIEDIVEREELVWNRRLERVDAVRRLYYEQLVIDETEVAVLSGPEVAQMLARRVREAGFLDELKQVEELDGRLDFLMRTTPGIDQSTVDASMIERATLEMCQGRRSLAEVRKAAEKGGLKRHLMEVLFSNTGGLGRLKTVAPERIRLTRGREVKVNYPVGGNPWIASRLQDFFGMRDGPTIADGRVRLVLHLLGPNQRPVQITSDLAGFWEKQYPAVRREMSRRYPRHLWPENPISAGSDR